MGNSTETHGNARNIGRDEAGRQLERLRKAKYGATWSGIVALAAELSEGTLDRATGAGSSGFGTGAACWHLEDRPGLTVAYVGGGR